MGTKITPPVHLGRLRGNDDRTTDHPTITGNLRIRPNRPGPNRTERRLEIDHIRDTPSCPLRVMDRPGRNVSEVRLRNIHLTNGVPTLMSQAGEKRTGGTNLGIRIGYTRISTVSQTLEQQQAALDAAGVARTFSDIMSGARDDRPGLTALMEYVREGDTVVVWKLDRLGRNTLHILETVKALTDRGVTLVSTSDGIDSSTAAGRMMIGVLGSLAEYESELTRERTALKRMASRANGTRFGRPKKVKEPDHIATARRMKADGHTAKDIARFLGVSRATLYRYLAS